MEPEQAAAIAVRRRGKTIDVCLIRRNESQVWGIPKGTIERGDTPEDTALNEAWEEAGLSGRLLGNAIGTYEYRKCGADLRVVVYIMEVLEEEAEWEEAHLRERRWAPLDEAISLLTSHPVRPLMDRVVNRLGNGASAQAGNG